MNLKKGDDTVIWMRKL